MSIDQLFSPLSWSSVFLVFLSRYHQASGTNNRCQLVNFFYYLFYVRKRRLCCRTTQIFGDTPKARRKLRCGRISTISASVRFGSVEALVEAAESQQRIVTPNSYLTEDLWNCRSTSGVNVCRNTFLYVTLSLRSLWWSTQCTRI